MKVESIEREALNLPPEERAKLARNLLESLDSLSAEEHERLWVQKADRRAREIDEGQAESLPGTEVSRKAQSLLK